MKETYKQRVLRFYKKERRDNLPAAQSLLLAKYEAKYGERSYKRDILPCQWKAYEGDSEHTLPNGWKLVFKLQYDNDSDPPWEDCHGMGVVTDWIHGASDEKYGWVLSDDNWSHRYYDWRATLSEAIRDGWDAAPYGVGNKHEKAMRAMKSTYELLRRWCNNDWWHVGLIVELYDKNGEELGSDSCWGFESDAMSYITEQMRSWAASAIIQARKAKRRETDAWKQLKLEIAA